ncbi:MAG: glycoside hydrolase family 127 protein [Anaeromyxobacter sp.]
MALDRREFLTVSALGALGLSAPEALALADAAPAGAQPRLEPFPLSRVRLLDGPLRDAALVNRRHLLALDPDRLLHTFRLTAGLPTTAAPLGGWEAPDNELRGHFTGHLLSACARAGAHDGDAGLRARGLLLVDGLAACQARLGTGYLSAFPEELFDRLRAGKPAWAPFYTLHKLMAGLLDTWQLSGSDTARRVLHGMVEWTARWVQPFGEDAMARVLEREYGGMNETLYAYAALTGEARWRELAHRFDRERILGPLAAGKDELQGLHVNTTLPQLVGAARGAEVTGDARLGRAARFLWTTVTERRCYCTGGTSNEESWNKPPGELAQELSGYTQECCVTYNLRKLGRQVLAWTGDARVADHLERTLWNGILGAQHPEDGAKLYYVPLAPGFWKLFGTPLHDFWCCSGSMAEAFATLGDGVYWKDDRGLYVSQYVASTLDWTEQGLRLEQRTRFPSEDVARFTVRAARPVRTTIRFRVPSWCRGGQATLNGRALEAFAEPGSWFALSREWRDGDRVELRLPMRLAAAPMPDDPNLVAATYGPVVLAARLGAEGLTEATRRAPPTKPRTVPEYPLPAVPAPDVVAASTDPATWLEPVPERPLEFQTRGQPRPLRFSPLMDVFDERYAVYLRVKQG